MDDRAGLARQRRRVVLGLCVLAFSAAHVACGRGGYDLMVRRGGDVRDVGHGGDAGAGGDGGPGGDVGSGADGGDDGSAGDPCLGCTPTCIQDVTAGTRHTCGWKADGTLQCWGSDFYGELGNNSTVNSIAPVAVLAPADVVAEASAGDGYSCARTLAGTLYCWGDNTNGLLGTGNTTPSLTPVAVSAVGATFKSISARIDHSCAVASDDRVVCWGAGDDGQLGDGLSTTSSTPVNVSTLTNVAAVAAGWLFSCALVSTTQSVSCWGSGQLSELGAGVGVIGSTVPVQVITAPSVNLVGVRSIATGLNHACAVKGDGSLWCWGNNADGEIMPSGVATYSVATEVTTLGANVRAVAAGGSYTCALTTDNELWCWGANFGGALGTQCAEGDTCAPAQVTALGSQVRTVVTGLTHTCATTTDGALWCWGANYDDQLGIDSELNPTCAHSVDQVQRYCPAPVRVSTCP